MLTLLNLKWTVDLAKRKLATMRDPALLSKLGKGL